MEELKEGLTDDELRKRITENPQLPWRPDFLVAADHERNKFWVDKILEESLKDADVSLATVSWSHDLNAHKVCATPGPGQAW
jgi:hypothetical protein